MYTKITDLDVLTLCNALQNNTSVKTLSLAGNHITNLGAIALAKTRLISLNLTCNRIEDAGAFALAGNQTIVNLNISSNKMTSDGLKAFANNKVIRTLNINNNGKINDVTMQAIAANTTLQSLQAARCGLSAIAAQALAANTTLEQLDIECNRNMVSALPAFLDNTNLILLNIKWITMAMDDPILQQIEQQIINNRISKMEFNRKVSFFNTLKQDSLQLTPYAENNSYMHVRGLP